mgnify:CR=1 FL=1|jgi:hypothetical protein
MSTVYLYIGDSAQALEQHANTLKYQPDRLVILYPEHRIHPRKQRDVVNEFFCLAEDFKITVFLYSLSTYIVDAFSSYPDQVFVIETTTRGNIVTKNLQHDIITPINNKFIQQNEEPIRYTDSLGTHWAMGFLGGVPLEN